MNYEFIIAIIDNFVNLTSELCEAAKKSLHEMLGADIFVNCL